MTKDLSSLIQKSNVAVPIDDVQDYVKDIYGDTAVAKSVKGFRYGLEYFSKYFDKKFEYFVEEYEDEFYLVKKPKVYGDELTVETILSDIKEEDESTDQSD